MFDRNVWRARYAKFLTPDEMSMWEEAWHILNHQVLREKPSVIPEAQISDHDFDKMCHLTDEISEQDVEGVVRLFTEPEVMKGRKRKVCWSKDHNDQYRPQQKVKLAQIEEIALHTNKFVHFSCQDVAAAYDSIPLAEKNRLFCFRRGEKIYSLRTIPTGHRMCTQLCQNTIVAMARAAVKQSGAVDSEVCVDVYIDNIRFGSNSRALLVQVTKCFHNICDEVGFILNEAMDWATNSRRPWAETGKLVFCDSNATHDFIGMKCDPRNNQISLTEGMVTKLRAMRRRLRERKSQTTLREIMAYFGKLNYAAQILRMHLARYFYALQTLRKLDNSFAKGNLKLTDVVTVPDAVIDVLETWCSEAIANTPRHAVRPERPTFAVICSDASMSGWGAVMYIGHRSWAVGGRWDDDTARLISETQIHINELECRAVRFALQTMMATLPQGAMETPLDIRLLLDNTAALHALQNAAARSYWLNREVHEIELLLRNHDLNVTHTAYVQSARNPADWFSRRQIGLTLFQTQCNILQLRQGGGWTCSGGE